MTVGELRSAYPPGTGPHACPCCHYLTLDSRAGYDICPECGWEDDGQDDPHAHEVWGGPNGSESLTDARIRCAESVANRDEADPDSVAAGGDGLWRSAARRARRVMRERHNLSEQADL